MLDAFQSYYVSVFANAILVQGMRIFSGCFSFVQLFLPTILSDFFAYSIANYDNWSWGTRESNPQSAPTPGATGGSVQPVRLPNPQRAAEELVSNKIRARSQRSARSTHQATTSSLVILQLGLAIFLIVFSVRNRAMLLRFTCTQYFSFDARS